MEKEVKFLVDHAEARVKEKISLIKMYRMELEGKLGELTEDRKEELEYKLPWYIEYVKTALGIKNIEEVL